MLSKQGRYRVAVHAAGHAVAAYNVSRAFKSVSIVSDEEQSTVAHAQFLPRPDWYYPGTASIDDARMRKRLECDVITSLGGDAAEALLTGRNAWHGADNEIHAAINAATYLTGSQEEAEAYVRWLYIRTKRLLQQPWNQAAIGDVADALVTDQKLNTTRARALIVTAIHRTRKTHGETP